MRSLSLVQLGDGPTELLLLPPGSAGLVLSDLPSGETAADFDTKPCWELFWPAVWRALRRDGLAVVMASSLEFAAEALASQPQHFRYELIWEKSLATGFLNARRRPLDAHEFILVFSRVSSKFSTYNPQMLVGFDPIHGNSRPLKERATIQISESYGSARSHGGQSRKGATDRYPRSVLHDPPIPTSAKPGHIHPQQKPQGLLRRLIRQYSKPGELVVDPYAGSGSTGAAAEAEGRRYVCFDNNPRWGRLAPAEHAPTGDQDGTKTVRT